MLADFRKLSGRFRSLTDRPDMVIIAAISRGLYLSEGTSQRIRGHLGFNKLMPLGSSQFGTLIAISCRGGSLSRL